MARSEWTIDELPWDDFDAGAVDADLLALAKAAALVEFNADDYTAYLRNVFHDDPGFGEEAVRWAEEETRHGRALGRWAERADPDWHFDAAVARFRASYRVETDTATSRRGGRVAELVSRCMVETGTSTYYTAMADRCREPVLKEICRHIAADELRHYKLFYGYAKTYQRRENPSRPARLKVAIDRWLEAEDEELGRAFHAANAPADSPYDHAVANETYARLAYGLYRRHHIDRALAMAFKASGLAPRALGQRIATAIAWWALRRRVRRAEAAAAA